MSPSRRRFLRGMGGAAVAAPFLSSIAEIEAKAQGTSVSTPKRLIVMFTHNGCLTTRYFPVKSHGPMSRDDYAALKTLSPMAPYAQKLLLVRGIRGMNEWSSDGTLGQKVDTHVQVCGSFFTCHPVGPTAPDGGPVSVGSYTAKPSGRSLDHIAAEQVNAAGSKRWRAARASSTSFATISRSCGAKR